MEFVAGIVSVLALLVSLAANNKASRANRISLFEHRLTAYKQFRKFELTLKKFNDASLPKEEFPPVKWVDLEDFKEEVALVLPMIFSSEIIEPIGEFYQKAREFVLEIEDMQLEYEESKHYDIRYHFMRFDNPFYDRAHIMLDETLEGTDRVKEIMRSETWIPN